jgi:hypothetical protein
VNYISDHLPNLQSAAKASTQATDNIMASDTYITLQAVNKAFKEHHAKGGKNKRRKRKDGKGGKGKGKKQQKGNRTNGELAPERTLKYCYAHGTQHTHTHTTQECKLMAGDKDRFTAAMCNAKEPENPPGGSTKVLAQ